MASTSNNEVEIVNIEEAEIKASKESGFCGSPSTVILIQKVGVSVYVLYMYVYSVKSMNFVGSKK